MGASKTSLFTKEQNDLASIAKVIGHPARVAILQHLIEQNACICGDIVKEIGLSQPTISQHLKELKSVGLIKGTIDGSKMCYCIDHEGFMKIGSIFQTLFTLEQSEGCQEAPC